MKKAHVELSDVEREQLQEMLRKGSLKSRTYKRVTALLSLDKGKTIKEVAEHTNVSRRTLERLSKSYKREGLDCLFEKPRPGRPVQLDQALEDKIVVLSCSDAPKGYSQWSLRLLAGKVVQLGYCDKISYSQVGKILKKRKSNPT